VNSIFKYHLQNIPSLPKKREMNTQLKTFIMSLIDCIYTTLNPQNIRKGFYKSHLLQSENNKKKLEENINCFLETLPVSCHLGVYFFFYFSNIIYEYKYKK
jgi:hypothetical protein